MKGAKEMTHYFSVPPSFSHRPAQTFHDLSGRLKSLQVHFATESLVRTFELQRQINLLKSPWPPLVAVLWFYAEKQLIDTPDHKGRITIFRGMLFVPLLLRQLFAFGELHDSSLCESLLQPCSQKPIADSTPRNFHIACESCAERSHHDLVSSRHGFESASLVQIPANRSNSLILGG